MFLRIGKVLASHMFVDDPITTSPKLFVLPLHRIPCLANSLNYPHFGVIDPHVTVFLTFSTNKRWWRLHTFSSLGRCTHDSRVALPLKGRLLQPSSSPQTIGLVCLWMGNGTLIVSGQRKRKTTMVFMPSNLVASG